MEKLDGLVTKVDSLEQKFDNLETRIDNLEDRFDKLEIKFDNLEDRFDKFEVRFDKLETKVDNMQAQLNESTQMLKAIIHRQDETDAKLDQIAMDVHKLHGQVSSLTDNQLKMQGEIANTKNELSFTALKTHRNEVEIFKLQNANGA